MACDVELVSWIAVGLLVMLNICTMGTIVLYTFFLQGKENIMDDNNESQTCEYLQVNKMMISLEFLYASHLIKRDCFHVNHCAVFSTFNSWMGCTLLARGT